MTMKPGIDKARTLGDSFASQVHDILAMNAGSSRAWRLADRSSPQWLRVVNRRVSPPRQGWKLHISAGVDSADEVIRRTLPILLADTASFKIARSRGVLAELNAGVAGSSQVGKFITVYPNDDLKAVRLAVALDSATRGLRGPQVPSDRPLAPGSLVHYRYGGFQDSFTRTSIGAVKPAILTPEGIAIPDERQGRYRPPDWVSDPFEEAGVTRQPPPPSLFLADRYLVLAPLHRSAWGSVHLAIDLGTPRRCVLKRARRGVGASLDGQDTVDRLEHEAEVLVLLGPDPRFPTVYDLVTDGEDLYLVMEDIEGSTLEQTVIDLVHEGRCVPQDTVVRWATQVASALDAIHGRGVLYRDLKSANIIITPEDDVRLVDFNAAMRLGADLARPSSGTFGYMAPGHERGDSPQVGDDIYGLGAVIYFMATGVEPSNAPNRFRLLDRSIRLLNPGISPGLEDIVARCLGAQPGRRFTSAGEVAVALDSLLSSDHRGSSGAHEAGLGEGIGELARTHARRLAETLCAVSEQAPGGLRYWRTSHDFQEGMRSPDINTGSAGTVLALTELADVFDEWSFRDVLSAGARGLIDAPRPAGPALAGLYVGESGVGAASLRAGQVLGDPMLLEAAANQSRVVAKMPWGSSDLFNGTAGRARFHLLVWDETRSDEHLLAAIAAGERLLETADTIDDSLCWPLPEAFDGPDGQAQPGYAHGAAGIGDVLLDLYDVTSEVRFHQAALQAGRWIAQHTFTTLEDDSGANWPVHPNGPRGFAFWCHGAAGIGRFLLHLGETGGFPDAARLAARAARTVVHGTRWAGPTQCHGLSGNIEFLLDMYQATGDEQYIADARLLGRLLVAFRVERDGLLLYPSESSRVFTPDYMVGYAGVAVALLRLADPRQRPHQLSRKGFSYRSSPGP
jgi:hypothetical protein